jgi:hypothetical protein
MNVVWLGAALLGGLAFALVPPLIHLISKRRARPVRFAAMEFVLRSQKRTARSLRLREFLLMALRAAVVIGIALAIARPALRPEVKGALNERPVAVIFVVDTSASMLAKEGRRSVFDKAIRNVLDELDALPDDVRVAVVGCGHRPEDWVAPPTFDRSLIRERLDRAVATYARSDLGACLAQASKWATQVKTPGEKRVQVHSDLARHALTPAQHPAPADLAVMWVQAADDLEKANHAITDVQIGREGGIMGQVLKVDFGVAHFGHGDSPPVAADLKIGERTVASQMVEMKARQRSRRTFTYALAATQGQREAPEDTEAPIQLQLADDALSVDNAVTLPMSWPRPLKVLLVDGAPRAVSFRDEVFFFENALRHQRAEDTELEVEVIAPEQVRHDLLAGAQVVVLANVDRLSDSGAASLIQFVRAGGGIAVDHGRSGGCGMDERRPRRNPAGAIARNQGTGASRRQIRRRGPGAFPVRSSPPRASALCRGWRNRWPPGAVSGPDPILDAHGARRGCTPTGVDSVHQRRTRPHGASGGNRTGPALGHHH